MNDKEASLQDLERRARITAPAEIGVLQEAKEVRKYYRIRGVILTRLGIRSGTRRPNYPT